MTLNSVGRTTPQALFNQTSGPAPQDKVRAAELYEQAKGTSAEARYREVSARHPDKNESAEAYRAFLNDIEGIFVAPAVTPAAPISVPVSAPSIPATGAVQESESGGDIDAQDGDADDEGTPNDQDDLNGHPGDDPGGAGFMDDDQVDPENSDVDSEESGAAANLELQTPVLLAPEQEPPVQVAPVQLAPTTAGLFTFLAPMLAEGGTATLQVMRIGEQLTVALEVKPTGNEEGVPFVVTRAPDALDANYNALIAPIASASAFVQQTAEEVAKMMRDKAAKTKTQAAATLKPTTSSKIGKKTHALTLQAAQGSTITGTNGPDAIPDLKIGENSVPQGTVSLTITHPDYPEVKKTLQVYGPKTLDARELQGARVTVKVTPDTAAVTAVKGDTRVHMHGETLLAPGTYTLEAEASGFKSARQTLKVQAGKAQVIQLDLEDAGGLF